MKKLYLIILLLAFAHPALGATHYVDLDDGSDSNGGTSTSDAWLNIPGTRNTGKTAFLSNSWATINAGDTIKIKSGTTHSSSDGGIVEIDSGFYATNATTSNYILIQRDTTWGTGAITFDGTGITTGGNGWGIIHTQIGGVKIDGVTSDGIVVQDAANNGFSHWPTSNTQAVSLQYMKFYNNGTSYAAENASAADIVIHRTINGGLIDNVNIDGNSSYINGIIFGESNLAAVGYTISNTTSANHTGNDDGGIGFKAYNSQLTFDNCTSYNNFKGFDLGEQSGSGRDITYVITNSISHSNSFGINMNNSQGSYAGDVNWYIINTVVRDNTNLGTNIYAGPYNLYILHSVFDNNGAANFDRGNVGVTVDTHTDDMTTVYMYNNILYKPNAGSGSGNGENLMVKRFADADGNFALYSDYNSWVAKGTEDAVGWSTYSFQSVACYFQYGADGPGNSSGDWYDFYGCDGSASSNGHYHADANSLVSTPADRTNDPPFTDQPSNDYTLTATYPGVDITGLGFYTALPTAIKTAIATDKDGVTRTLWDMGAYESGEAAAPANSIQGVSISELKVTDNLTAWNRTDGLR